MATKFILISQVHRSKTSISTRKSRQCNKNKPRPSKSIRENMINNVFPRKSLTENYQNSQNSDTLTNSLLHIEDHLLKEEETGQQEHEKVSKHEDLRGEVARLSLLWYMKCSISFMLRKARAFYNEFCCDTHVPSSDMVVVDPYFSVPVLPFSS
ncbi:unnamed protein product [Cochlearia groenlandica]